MKLHPVDHDVERQMWCGPAIVAAVTADPLSIVYEEFKRDRKRRKLPTRVMATNEDDLKNVLKRYGYEFTLCAVYYEEHPTLETWAFCLQKSTTHAYALILKLPDCLHWVVVSGAEIVDSHHPRPKRLSTSKYRSKLVDSVYLIRPRTD